MEEPLSFAEILSGARSVRITHCGRELLTFVDSEDVQRALEFRWYLTTSGTGYATTSARLKNGIKSTLYLHRLILGSLRGETVDHKNGNGLDNRRFNLRRCTQQQNVWGKRKMKNNKSGYTGVWREPCGTYSATIFRDGKKKWLGTYADKEDAHAAYQKAAKELFGEFARG
jgi:hypothetical protein